MNCLWAMTILLGLFGITTSARAADNVAPLEKRPKFALIVGNSEYQQVQLDSSIVGTLRNLRNPCNDAMTIAAQLQQIGWDEKDIDIKCNLSKSEISTEMDRFAQRFSYSDAPTGLVYFSGHGVQVNERNYVFGVGASPDIKKSALLSAQNPSAKLFISDAEDISTKLVSDIGDVLDGALLVVLDACRDNPLIDELISNGVKLVSRPQAAKTLPGIVFSFATSGGAVANDGFGDNSPFAQALAESIRAGDTIDDILAEASTKVVDSTKGRSWEQIPDKKGFFKQPPKRCFSDCPAGSPPAKLAQLRESIAHDKLTTDMRRVSYDAGINRVNSTSDYIVSQASQATDERVAREKSKEFIPPRVIYERDPSSVSKVPLSAINIDVFWCDGDELSDSRRVLASEIGAAAGVLARMNANHSQTSINRVRSRALPVEVNSQPDYSYRENVLRYDSESPGAAEWARTISSMSPTPLVLSKSRASVPDYISIFLCADNDLKARPGRVYFQLANQAQEKFARFAISDIRASMRNVSVAEGLDFQPKNSPNKTQIRYYSKTDRETAEMLAESVGRKTGEIVEVRSFERLGNSSTNGTFEVWLGKNFTP